MEKDATALTWGEIYKSIKEQAYVELYATKEEMKECDKNTWVNIRRSMINQVSIALEIFPYGEFIRLTVKQSDLEN